MDAIILVQAGGIIIKAEDNTIFKPSEGEDQDKFCARVADELFVKDGESTKFVDIDEAKAKKKSTKQIESLVNKSDNMAEVSYYMELLEKRAGKIEPKAKKLTDKEIDEQLEKAEKAPAKKAPAKKAPAKKAPAKKAPAKKAPAKKAPRVKAEKPSDAIFEAATVEAKENIGKKIKFIPNGREEVIEGRIRGIMRDKRVNFVYYRIQLDDAKKTTMHKHVGVDEIIKIY